MEIDREKLKEQIEKDLDLPSEVGAAERPSITEAYKVARCERGLMRLVSSFNPRNWGAGEQVRFEDYMLDLREAAQREGAALYIEGKLKL